MTPQETQLLNDLVRRVRETQLTEKDPEAEQLLRDGLASQPDALYILAQTALVQNITLQQAGAQIEQLKQQLQQAQQVQRPARATSFLGSLLGHHEDEQQAPPQQIPQQQRPGFSGQPQYQQQPQYQPIPVPAGGYASQPIAQPQPVSGGGSSFLRSAATTAAGVAAGALAFEGIESLFRGMTHPSGFGGFGPGYGGFGSPVGMGGFGSAPVEETVVNNYYDSPDPNREHHEQEASYDERPGGHETLDRSDYDRDNSSARVENASYDPGGDNNMQDQDLQDDSDLQEDDDSNYDGDDSGQDDFSDDGGDFSGGDDSSFV